MRTGSVLLPAGSHGKARGTPAPFHRYDSGPGDCLPWLPHWNMPWSFRSFTSGRSLKPNTSRARWLTAPNWCGMMLEESCEEMARNGIRKIIIVNGHGGNNNLFSAISASRSWPGERTIPWCFSGPTTGPCYGDGQLKQMRKTDYGGHADEVETSMVSCRAARPGACRTCVLPIGQATRKGFPCPMAIRVSGGMPVFPTTMPEMDRSPTRPWGRWFSTAVPRTAGRAGPVPENRRFSHSNCRR
jgi:hypothetical protein